MGEKVQTVVRIQDQNFKKVAEFVLHEKYGGGIFSCMNALHLAINMPNGYNIKGVDVYPYNAAQGNFKKNARNHKLYIKQIATANDLYQKIAQTMSGTRSSMYFEAFSGTPMQTAKKFMTCNSQEQIDDIFIALQKELFDQDFDEQENWDNQDGYIKMTVRYKGSGSKITIPEVASLRFFNHKKQQITVKQFINNDILAHNFINLAKNLSIKFPAEHASAIDEESTTLD